MLNKILKLERPLAVLDFETTGLDPVVDRVIQISLTMHYPDKDPIPWMSFFNPGVPILNSDKHSISDEMVADAPSFAEFAGGIARHTLASDISGYNVMFDIKFMREEMKRAGVLWDWDNYVIDPLQIYKMKRGHTLTNCYLEYGGEYGQPLPPGTNVDEAHDAAFDTFMTEMALYGQLQRYELLPRTVKELAGFCFPHPENAIDKTGKFVWRDGQAAIAFGKHRGTFLKDLNRGYLSWMAGADFPDDVKKIAEDAKNGIFPTKDKS